MTAGSLCVRLARFAGHGRRKDDDAQVAGNHHRKDLEEEDPARPAVGVHHVEDAHHGGSEDVQRVRKDRTQRDALRGLQTDGYADEREREHDARVEHAQHRLEAGMAVARVPVCVTNVVVLVSLGAIIIVSVCHIRFLRYRIVLQTRVAVQWRRLQTRFADTAKCVCQ